MENLSNEIKNEIGQTEPKFNKKYFYYLVGLTIFLSFSYFLFLSPPADFPVGSIVKIEKGSNLHNISSLLEKEHLIRSRVAFESFVIIFGAELHIVSANYLFEGRLPVWEIAKRIARGEHRMAPISITIPEGYDVKQIGDAIAIRLTNFNEIQFLLKAKDLEGYLFPDTYFFLADADEKIVIKSMTDNFEKKIIPLRKEIVLLKKNEKDIITMASIIERESKGDIDREIISGILWKRIRIGMPLQVDAAPGTYQTRGLPKNPISNPGLLAIKASIYPENSPYLYYLHDKDGGIHYAKTFAEHVQNKLKYLK